MMAGSTMVARPATRTTGRSERGCDGCGAPYGCRATPGGQASLRRAGHGLRWLRESGAAGARMCSGSRACARTWKRDKVK